MGLGIPKDDQPFIGDGNICKGIEISCCSVLQYLAAECLIQNTALKCISVVVRNIFGLLGFGIISIFGSLVLVVGLSRIARRGKQQKLYGTSCATGIVKKSFSKEVYYVIVAVPLGFGMLRILKKA